MKNIYKTIILLCFVAYLGCEKDDSADPTVVTARQSTITILDNVKKDEIIGIVPGATNAGTLEFELLSQSLTGAFIVSDIGEIIVDDATLINADINPQILLEVTISKENISDVSTVTVNVDKFCLPLNNFRKLKASAELPGIPFVLDNEVSGINEDCNTLKITGDSFFLGFCNDYQLELILTPSLEDETIGTVEAITGSTTTCNGSELIYQGTGTYDLNTETIIMNYLYRFGAGGDIPRNNVVYTIIPDRDNDGIEDDMDNCPDRGNPQQRDNDGDGIGDECDDDDDNDGVLDTEDNCPFTPNPDQMDSDDNGIGDACEVGPCTSTVNTSLWNGERITADVSGNGFPAIEVEGVSNCNELVVIGDFLSFGCEVDPEITIVFTEDSPGATTGTVAVVNEAYECSPSGPVSHQFEGTGTYDETTGTIIINYTRFVQAPAGTFQFQDVLTIKN